VVAFNAIPRHSFCTTTSHQVDISRNNQVSKYKNGCQRYLMLHCFLETSTHLQEAKLKVVVVFLSRRVERDKTLGEEGDVNFQLISS
jgi:hypothetical protein